MYGSLTGTVTGRLDQRILLQVNNIGYWVHTGSWQPEGDITCYLHHHVREEASDLYGFPDLDTLHLFEQLISVSGIGPKAGLAILSVGSSDHIRNALAREDVEFLCRAPGIGKKVAQKAVLELSSKVRLPVDLNDALSAANQPHADLLAALESLGYKRAQLLPLLSKIPAECATIDSQIRWVLQQSIG
jgi:Holliday junction DNA helicase RuvA